MTFYLDNDSDCNVAVNSELGARRDVDIKKYIEDKLTTTGAL